MIRMRLSFFFSMLTLVSFFGAQSAIAGRKSISCNAKVIEKKDSTATVQIKATFSKRLKRLRRSKLRPLNGSILNIKRISRKKSKTVFQITLTGRPDSKLTLAIKSGAARAQHAFRTHCPRVQVSFPPLKTRSAGDFIAPPENSNTQGGNSQDFTNFGFVLPASLTAEGHGSATLGGSGRNTSPAQTNVIKVINVNDSGPGSLRACVEQAGPRTCIFEVSGTIRLQKELKVSTPYLTIAGSTAPSPGIALRGATLNIEASEVHVNNIYIMPGDDIRPVCCKQNSCSAAVALTCTSDPGSRDGIRIGTSSSAIKNILVDHVSVHWALDEGLSVVPDKGDVSNVTVSNSIIASGLDLSVHPEASVASDPGHSKGVLMKGKGAIRNISFIKNILAHNADRNIRAASNISMEYINNIVYNWGRGGGGGRLIELSNETKAIQNLDLIGNQYIPGPDSFCPTAGYEAERCFEANNDGLDSPEEQMQMSYMLRIGSGTKSGLNQKSKFYLFDNLTNTRRQGEDDWLVADSRMFTSTKSKSATPSEKNLIYPSNRSSAPVAPSSKVATFVASDAYNQVLALAGARAFARNRIDQAIINQIHTRTGQIINCVADDGTARCKKNAGGWPLFETNVRQLSLPSRPDADDDLNGFTNLEDWIRSLRS